MFKKSDSHSQLDLFSSPTEYFRGSKKKEYLIIEFRGAPKTGGYYFTSKVDEILNK